MPAATTTTPTARSAKKTRRRGAQQTSAPGPTTSGATTSGANGDGIGPTDDERHQSDAELIDATLDAVMSGLPLGPDAEQTAAAAARLGRAASRQPAAALRRSLRFAAEQGRILTGTSTVTPASDRRFADDTWSTNPLFKGMAQSYLAWRNEVHGFIDDLDLDDKSKVRSEFLANLVTEAVAPTNNLLTNPAALKESARTGGRSLSDGFRHFVHDMVENGGMPSTVDTRPFIPGETVAATPGNVVFTNPILELIQYRPTTAKVFARPLVVLPPQINKYYILDLAPGRSLVEHAVAHGHQVFMVSWRNPGPEHRAWGLDDYVAAVIEATDAVLEITDSEDLNVLGVCAGGMTAAALLGHLAAIDDHRVNAVSFLVTVLDWEYPSTMGTMMSRPVVEASTRRSQQKGILAGEDLSRIFAWLRPNDLVWNYWTNNYLMGKNPPAFDVLAWNADSTNLPAALHADFMDVASRNAFTIPGEVDVCDTPVDLGQIDVPAYVVGAVTDHITPWQACYETVNLLGGDTTFVLSSQGHIQALVNPSGNPKGTYHTNPATPEGPDDWLAEAEAHPGSWWDDWVVWLTPHGGRKVAAPTELGSEQYPAGVAAPGTYVVA
ncbi:MAG: PHA/PHB synthase family protein [Acidimicrobiales bacterium]